jgi:hypothetical protein
MTPETSPERSAGGRSLRECRRRSRRVLRQSERHGCRPVTQAAGYWQRSQRHRFASFFAVRLMAICVQFGAHSAEQADAGTGSPRCHNPLPRPSRDADDRNFTDGGGSSIGDM